MIVYKVSVETHNNTHDSYNTRIFSSVIAAVTFYRDKYGELFKWLRDITIGSGFEETDIHRYEYGRRWTDVKNFSIEEIYTKREVESYRMKNLSFKIRLTKTEVDSTELNEEPMDPEELCRLITEEGQARKEEALKKKSIWPGEGNDENI